MDVRTVKNRHGQNVYGPGSEHGKAWTAPMQPAATAACILRAQPTCAGPSGPTDLQAVITTVFGNGAGCRAHLVQFWAAAHRL